MKRILIIDGHPFIRSLITRSLKSGHMVVAPYETVEKAASYVKEYSCDLCFLDLKLREEDAVKDVELLRRMAPGAKVIAMSGADVSDGLMRKLQNNACHLIRKPFLPSDIRSLACDALGLEEPLEFRESSAGRKQERRASERKAISRRIVYEVSVSGRGAVRRNGYVVNISESGMLMVTASPVAAGNQLRFSFGVEKSGGAVAWSRKNENDTYSAGVMFIQPAGS